MNERRTKNSYAYELGTFYDIESPVIFKDNANFKETVEKAGYIKRHGHGEASFGCDIEVYSVNLPVDSDYPYMVVCDIALEGRICFMKKWYDVSHFINNHGLFALLDRMEFISEQVAELHIFIEGSR